MNQDLVFIAEIKQREITSKNFSNYIASFEYFVKSLIVLSGATGSVSIASFATVIGAPVEMMSASSSLPFSITTGFAKKNFKSSNK